MQYDYATCISCPHARQYKMGSNENLKLKTVARVNNKCIKGSSHYLQALNKNLRFRAQAFRLESTNDLARNVKFLFIV